MWFFELNGSQHGPETTEQIRLRLRNGELSAATLVWREGLSDWIPLAQNPEFQSVAQPAVAPVMVPNQPMQYVQGAPGIGMPPSQNGLAITSMILAICGLFLTVACGVGALLGIPAVILGHISRRQIREAGGSQTGDGLALTGLILGYLAIGIMVLMGVFIGIALISESSSGSTTFP